MRLRAWMVLGTLGAGVAAISACPAPTGFQCQGDDDCWLNDDPGVCVDTGHCAYPDGECPSGLRYPPGAGTLGGMCVPGELMPQSTGDVSSGSTDDPPTDPSLSGNTTAVDPDPETTSGVVTGMSDSVASESGTSVCRDDDYPDDPGGAEPTATTGENPECWVDWSGMTNDEKNEDRDYLVWTTECFGVFSMLPDDTGGAAIGYCAIPQCYRDPALCLEGVWDDVLEMCCNADGQPVTIDLAQAADCFAGEPINWEVLVRGTGCDAWNVFLSIG